MMKGAENPNWLAHSYEFRALVAYLRGDYARARELLSSALPLYLQIGNRVCSAHCLETTAALAAATGRPDVGATLLGAAERMRELLGHHGAAVRAHRAGARRRRRQDRPRSGDNRAAHGNSAASSASSPRWRGLRTECPAST